MERLLSSRRIPDPDTACHMRCGSAARRATKPFGRTPRATYAIVSFCASGRPKCGKGTGGGGAGLLEGFIEIGLRGRNAIVSVSKRATKVWERGRGQGSRDVERVG
eukprot:356000-Chlamydomonas_euryale.AAC.7